MGTQQLLLIVVGIIIVAIAISMGVILFRANAIEQKRNNVISECVNLAAMAQQHYLKPVTYGGGGYSFGTWSIPSELVTTANGHYRITNISETEVIILGTGNEVVTAGDSIKVEITIPAPPGTYLITTMN